MIKRIKEKIKLLSARRREMRIANIPSAYDNDIVSWVTPEYIRHERGLVWKIVMPIIVIASAIAGFYYDNWTFSVAIVALAIVYSLVHLEHPKNVEVKLSDIGIKVGTRVFPYGRIKSFWLIYEPPYVETLNFYAKGSLTEMTIYLNGQDPSQIRDFLINKIPEIEGKTEALSDIFLRIFKI